MKIISLDLEGTEIFRRHLLADGVATTVAPGKHRLELKRTGYRVLDRMLTVPEAGTVEVSEMLELDLMNRAPDLADLFGDMDSTTQVRQRPPFGAGQPTTGPLELLEALNSCGGNQTRAAELLGISRRTLVNRLNAYNLPRPRKGR